MNLFPFLSDPTPPLYKGSFKTFFLNFYYLHLVLFIIEKNSYLFSGLKSDVTKIPPGLLQNMQVISGILMTGSLFCASCILMVGDLPLILPFYTFFI